MKILISIITLSLIFLTPLMAVAQQLPNQQKQYYKFKGSDAFQGNTLFERNGNNFSPIMGAWNEDSFKKRSGGQGFDKVINLNTTFENVMKANPTWKQRGVILPKGTNYEVYGKPTGSQYNDVANIVNKIKPKKKYKFDFTEDFSKTLDGRKIISNYETNPKYKEAIRKGSNSQEDTINNKKIKTGGSTFDAGNYFEIKLNPTFPKEEYEQTLLHEIGHSLLKKNNIPKNLFLTDNTSMHYGNIFDFGKTTISKSETLANHFADYINNNKIYRERYPREAEFFDNYLQKRPSKQAIQKVKNAIKRIPDIIRQTRKQIKKLPRATLYSPSGETEPVDIGSERASFLQSKGWTLTPIK